MTALAILKKDIRHLWPQILLFWLLLALFSWLDPLYSIRASRNYFGLIGLALVAAFGSLIVAVVQQEAFPGDRQYWLTRPIDRRALWLAKTAFVALLVYVPSLASRCVVLVALDIPPGEYLPGLVWRELFCIAFYTLPVAALGAVTRNLVQALFTAILILVAAATASSLIPAVEMPREVVDGDLLRMLFAIVLMGSATILWIQYARRRTLAARAVMLSVTLVICLFGRLHAPSIASLPLVAVSLDPQPAHPAPPAPPGSLQFPIRIEGAPTGLDVTVDGRMEMIGDPGADSFEYPVAASIAAASAGRGWLTASDVQGWLSHRIDVTISLHARLELAFSTSGVNLPLPGKTGEVVPGIGRCTGIYQASVVCDSPFPRTALALEWPCGDREWIVGESADADPLLGALRLRRIERYYVSPRRFPAGARLITRHSVARRSATLDLKNIRLADYLVRD
jgi:hypothetical protein